MTVKITYDAYYPLSQGSSEHEHVRSLQRTLKRLGFYGANIDGDFGPRTEKSVRAAQLELQIPVTGKVDQNTAQELQNLLQKAEDGERWKMPTKAELQTPSNEIMLYNEMMREHDIPPAFADALGEQESDRSHFDNDEFVLLRCEFWGQYKDKGNHPDYETRYRSYGMMQILDMGHPEDDYTRGHEVGNITNREIRESVEKNIEAGINLLKNNLQGKKCVYAETDNKHYKCKECIMSRPTVNRDWTDSKYHQWKCGNVPNHTQIPCAWPEAIRRYNGSGDDAEAYRDEILTRITGAERVYKS